MSLIVVLAAAMLPASARAQGSREETLANAQAEKARSLEPPVASWIERKLIEIEQTGGFGVSRGLFVTFGGIKSGSSVAAGPLYGRTFASGALFQAKAVYSVREFKLGQVFLQSAPLSRGRLLVNGRARWQDAPELAFYGLGPDSTETRADYAETMTEVSGQAIFRPVRVVRLAGGLGYEWFETGPSSSERSEIDDLFADVPGMHADPTYLHTYASAAFDSRKAEGYSRSGTLAKATLHDYRDQSDGDFTFQRVDSVVEQLIPILHGNWVIGLSAKFSTTATGGGNQVPFFLMPYLGSSHDLRGYNSYRFRDRHSLALAAEYRWYAQEWVDMAVFVDAGKVAARRGDLDLDGLKSDVGIGIRFHTPGMTVLRVEFARGTEGSQLRIAFGPVIQ